MTQFPRLEDLDVSGKKVLLRTDLNVPMQGGKITDHTRILRLLPTLDYLIAKKAKIILLSHFGRPKGKFVPSLSLAPLVDALSSALGGKDIHFGVDCIGTAARDAVSKLAPGDIVLLENLRFHPQEESGDANFARELASLGDVFVNDAFSASHRAHASITGIAQYLPIAAGRLMEQEIAAIGAMFSGGDKPIAVIGGSKVSTKLALLQNLTKTMHTLIIGGAMANTFLHAQGYNVGKSLVENDLALKTALSVFDLAEKNGCRIILPIDVVVADHFSAQSPCTISAIDAIPPGGIAVDVGPASLQLFAQTLTHAKTVLWNGPIGAFETSPFDAGTIMLARMIAGLTTSGKIQSIAGGGDTVSALNHAGLAACFTYLSTGGGAFLEWLEGKSLPGVAVLTAESQMRVVIAHDLAQAKTALETAQESGLPITIQSAPDAIFYAGSLYLLHMFREAAQAFPAARASFILDCHDAKAEAIDAIRLGHKTLRSSAPDKTREKLSAIAQEHGAQIVGGVYEPLDLARARDTKGACKKFLGEQ